MKRRTMPDWYSRAVYRRNIRLTWGMKYLHGTSRGVMSTLHRRWSVRDDMRFDREIRAADHRRRDGGDATIKATHPLDVPLIVKRWRRPLVVNPRSRK